MSEGSVIIDRVKAHPMWLIGGVVVVVVFMMTRSSNAASTSAPVTAVVSTGLDPTAAALQSQDQTNQYNMSIATLQAQQNEQSLSTALAITQSNNAANVNIAQIGANVANAQTAASIFGTATQGLLLSGDGSSGAPSFSTTGTGNPLNETVEPGGPGWAPWMQNYIGSSIPIVSGGNPTNATSNQIAELFNNVIRAGQGTAPMQTVTMQNGGQQIATGTIDPVFAVWNGTSATPTITDITIDGNSPYGYTGSVYNPATMSQAQVITPTSTTPSVALPKVAL